jgi:hypothetical protein
MRLLTIAARDLASGKSLGFRFQSGGRNTKSAKPTQKAQRSIFDSFELFVFLLLCFLCSSSSAGFCEKLVFAF